jgi:hypothetical protein
MYKFFYYLKLTMAVAYTAIGLYILINPSSLSHYFSTGMSYALGALVLSYGCFRTYQAYKKDDES